MMSREGRLILGLCDEKEHIAITGISSLYITPTNVQSIATLTGRSYNDIRDYALRLNIWVEEK